MSDVLADPHFAGAAGAEPAHQPIASALISFDGYRHRPAQCNCEKFGARDEVVQFPTWDYRNVWIRRIPVETLCSEVVDDREHYGMLVELSPNGVRLERPLGGRRDGESCSSSSSSPTPTRIIWAKGEVCFDRYRRLDGASAVRTTGVRLVAAASRHLRMLRDWVAATVEARQRAREDDVAGISRSRRTGTADTRPDQLARRRAIVVP